MSTRFSWEMKSDTNKRFYNVNLFDVSAIESVWFEENHWWQCTITFKNSTKTITVWIQDIDFKMLKRKLAEID